MLDDPPRLAGRYELGDTLGRGGMAEVRRGVDLKLGRSVAIKLLKADLAADPGALKRFQREAHSVAILNHPAIAAVYDTGERVDPVSGLAVPYLVMELVEGATLGEVLRGEGPIPVDRTLEIVGVVLDALEHSHAAGIIHRDIKPSNIMITPSGAIKVMDFGIARAVTETTSGLTGTAMVIGTAAYLSPEQAQGQQVDFRSDLYSTGCLMYELLLNRPPFVGESSISVAYQHVREMATPPSQFDPSLGPDLDALVLKALAKNPDARYQSAAEMSADVARVQAGEPVRPVPAEVPTGLQTTTAPLAVTDPTVVAAEPTMPAAEPTVVAPPTRVATAAPPRRSGARTALVAILLALVVAGLAFGLYRLLGPGAGGVAVPSVLGIERSEAEQRLVDAGLQPAFRHVSGSDDNSRDMVVAQNPAEGTQVEPGTTVLAEINVGPATTEIPDNLVGRDLDRVLKKLADEGFVNVSAVPVAEPPADADAEEVLAVEPGEGELAALEQDIVVRYAGSAGQQTEEAPDEQTEEPATDEPEATDEPTDDNQGSNEDNEGSKEDNEGSNEDNEGSNEGDESDEPTDEPTTEEPTDEPSTEEPTESASESPAGESSGGASESPDADELEELEEPEAGAAGE